MPDGRAAASSDRVEQALVERIGLGNLAVLDGNPQFTKVVAVKPMFEDPSAAWALEELEGWAKSLDRIGGDAVLRPIWIAFASHGGELHRLLEPVKARAILDGSAELELDYPPLKPEHLRHVQRGRLGEGLHLFKVSPGQSYVEIGYVSKNDPGARFRDKRFRYRFDGLGYTRSKRYLLVNGDTAPISKYADELERAKAKAQEQPVFVRYAFDDGVTLTGNTKVHKDRIRGLRGETTVWRSNFDGKAPVPKTERYSFRWSGRQRRWFIPKSRNTLRSRGAIAGIAEDLRARGIPQVEVVYVSPERHGRTEPPDEPVKAEPPAPHGWPVVKLDDATRRLSREGQLRRLPVYGPDDYRWHPQLVSGRGETPRWGYATNIEGHEVIANPPSAVGGRLWAMTIDGKRWGRAREEFFELANDFHEHRSEALARAKPTRIPPDPRQVKADEQAIAEARKRVRTRKRDSEDLATAAREAGVEVCPKAVFELDPKPEDPEETKKRADIYARAVKLYRALHDVERFAMGKLRRFPRGAGDRLRNFKEQPERDYAANPHLARSWAKSRYAEKLAELVEELDADEPKEAARVLEFCVRDVESGARKARPKRIEQLAKVQRTHPAPSLLPGVSSSASKAKPRVTPPVSSPSPRKREPKAKPKSFRMTSGRKHVLSVAGNAWKDEPGSSTNVHTSREKRAARDLIRAGYLEKTGDADWSGHKVWLVRLTDKGRRWLVEHSDYHRELPSLELETEAPQQQPEPKSKPEETDMKRKPKAASKGKSKKKAPPKVAKKTSKKSTKSKKSKAKTKKSKAKTKKSKAKAGKGKAKKASKTKAKKTSKAKSTKSKAKTKKSKAKTKKTSTKKTKAKKTSKAKIKKTSAKKTKAKKTSKAKAGKTKTKKTPKPRWRYTTYRKSRYRFRELGGEFFAERRKGSTWVLASKTAAEALRKKADSPCAVAARILSTCGASSIEEQKKRLRRPNAAEKAHMRALLGL